MTINGDPLFSPVINQLINYPNDLFFSSTAKDELVRQMARLKPVAAGLQKQRDLAPLEAWAEAAPWLSSGGSIWVERASPQSSWG
jgi:hypothetical protein